MKKISAVLTVFSFLVGIGAILFSVAIHSMGFDKPVFAFDSAPVPISPNTVFYAFVFGIVAILLSALIFVISGGLRSMMNKS